VSDPGAISRNTEAARIALERASQSNGGQNPPPTPPQSVTAADYSPAAAVSQPVPNVTQDSVLSWGRAGQVESSPGGLGDDTAIPLASGFQGGEHLHAAPPRDLGRVRPVPDLSRDGGPGGSACNSMADILAKTRIG